VTLDSPPCTADPDLWFSERKADQAKAMETCLSCPLMVACRELGEKEEYGIWGGVLSTHPIPDDLCEIHPIEGPDDIEIVNSYARCRACRREKDRIRQKGYRAARKTALLAA
jgi:hypothetical protein